jgi:peptidoglycan hydrolase CwlO-like protein
LIKPKKVMKSKGTEMSGKDPLKELLEKIKLDMESLQSELQRKFDCIQRLEYIVDQKCKENTHLKKSMDELKKLYEDFEYRVKEAEKIAKLKSRMVIIHFTFI